MLVLCVVVITSIKNVTFSLCLFSQSIKSTFVKRSKSRANRRRMKRKARPSGYRKPWQRSSVFELRLKVTVSC